MDGQRWREQAGSFGARPDVYDRSRPSYPVDAVRWLLPDGAHRVLDLGAGTGKLTQVLLDLGLDVVALEPDEQMRSRLPARAELVEGSAEDIPCPDGSFDAVLVGHAFHWFDTDRAIAEMARVVRPGGVVGLLWHWWDDSVEWVGRVSDLFGGEDRLSLWDDTPPFEGRASLTTPEVQRFRYVQSLDSDLLVDLVAVRGALQQLPEQERLELLARVRDLAPETEPFDMPYETAAWRSVRS